MRDGVFRLTRWLSPPRIPCNPLQISRKDWQSVICQNIRAIRSSRCQDTGILSACRFFRQNLPRIDRLSLQHGRKDAQNGASLVLTKVFCFVHPPVYSFTGLNSTFHFLCPDFAVSRPFRKIFGTHVKK